MGERTKKQGKFPALLLYYIVYMEEKPEKKFFQKMKKFLNHGSFFLTGAYISGIIRLKK